MVAGVTTRYYNTLQKVLQDTKSRVMRYYDTPWHYMNDEVIQDAILG